MNSRELSSLIPWLTILQDVGAAPGRYSRTCCPLHDGDNSTSFTFSDKTGKGHCFSCGWHGDKIDFLKGALGIDFKTALARLANLAGVQLTSYHKLDRTTLTKARAHRTALSSAREAFKHWQRETFLNFSDEYREVNNRPRQQLESAFRDSCLYLERMTDEQSRQIAQDLGELYDRLGPLEWDLEVLTLPQHEARRFLWWQEESNKAREAA